MKSILFIIALLTLVACQKEEIFEDPIVGLSMKTNAILIDEKLKITATVTYIGNRNSITYKWFVDNEPKQEGVSDLYEFSHSTIGYHKILCIATVVDNNTFSIKDSVEVAVIDRFLY